MRAASSQASDGSGWRMRSESQSVRASAMLALLDQAVDPADLGERVHAGIRAGGLVRHGVISGPAVVRRPVLVRSGS